MEVYFQLVKTEEQLRKVCDEIFDSEPAIGLDTETTSFDPHLGRLRLIQMSNGRTTVVIDLDAFSEMIAPGDNETLAPLRRLLSDKTKIKFIHNAKFDVKWIKHHLGVEVAGVFDTMLASILLAAGDQEKRHSLAEASLNFLQVEVDKSEQSSDWSNPELTESQLRYAAADALMAYRLGKKLEELLLNEAMMKVAGLEFDAVVPLSVMEMNGMHVDKILWEEKLENTHQRKKNVEEELKSALARLLSQKSLFSTKIQIDLEDQSQLNGLLSELGIQIPAVSGKMRALRKISTDFPQLNSLIEYQSLQKTLTDFGKNFLASIKQKTNRVHCDYRQIGNTAGYIKSNKPNLQQIPSDYRACFVAPEGKKIVTAKYEDLELRTLAFLSDEGKLIEALKDVENPHREIAAQIFGTNGNNITPDHISLVRRLNMAIVYGAGASFLADITGTTQENANKLMNLYFSAYPKVKLWLEKLTQRVEDEKLCRSLSGRLYRPKLDGANKRKALRRYAQVFAIQSLIADLIKRSLSALHENLADTSAKLIGVFQHGFIIECGSDDVEAINALVRDLMKKRAAEYLSGVPINVTLIAGDFWEI